ncbi:quinone oxidoreductase family protein [Ruixingdingia sedimenti]|uniref:NADP-dependent oxidoreductase n=1 Tax=Ruixingdingia sedimenti TaxID=3073604 RepID=A0ABU1F8E6_9RHOB|nr:NADP-dependent oxidoreductase [Xinfangfangia sp. LG-4]MDR5653145.1 NADP-dependent oxidoreductase [Xinfangfangia sp. LG-4]
MDIPQDLATATQVWRVEHDRPGGPEVLTWRKGPLPPPAPGEARVAVRAASVNPVDGKIRAGRLPGLPPAFPATTGRDGAGRVLAVGPGVAPGWLNRRVAFLAPRGEGTWGMAVNLPVAALAEIPAGVDDLAAAALPLAGISAARALALGGLWPLRPAPGLRVLVHAGAGGVGRIAVQLARLTGAEVHATASSASRAAVEALGARLWAYDVEDFTALRDVDLVIDTMGGEVHHRSHAVLRPGGLIACLRAAPFADRSAETGMRVEIAEIAPDAPMLAALLDLVAQGQLDPGPAQVLPASGHAEAQRLSDSGHLRGKLVLDFGAP